MEKHLKIRQELGRRGSPIRSTSRREQQTVQPHRRKEVYQRKARENDQSDLPKQKENLICMNMK